MDAVILAGGYATRLWPLTKNRSKVLLPLGEKTIIDLIVDDLKNAGIDDVYVSTNEAFADDLQKNLSNVNISVEGTTTEEEKLGVVGALGELIERESLSDDTIVVAGDNVFGFDLGDFVNSFEENPMIATSVVDDPRQFGVVGTDGDQVVDFVEKPDKPPSNLASLACYAFPQDTLNDFDTYLSSGNNPDEPGHFISWLKDQRTVLAETYTEEWFDVGTRQGYLDALDWYRDDEYIAPNVDIKDTHIEGNSCIMSDVTIEDSTIGSSVVFPESTIEMSHVRDSLVEGKVSGDTKRNTIV